MWFKKKYQGTVIRSSKKSPPNKRFSILVIIFLGASAVIMLKEPPKTKKPPVEENPVLSDEMIQKKIKKHSKTIQLKKKLDRDQTLFKAQSTKLNKKIPLDNALLDNRFTSKGGVDLDQEELFKDLLSDMDHTDDYEDIEDHIASYQKYQKIEETLKSYKEEKTEDETDIFVQEFLNTAKEQGYLIQLNDNLDVESIKKIK